MKDENAIEYQLETIRDYIRYGASLFTRAKLYYGHGTDNAWDEAYALVRHVLAIPYESPKTIGNCRLTLEERYEILDLFQKRIDSKTPVPYITHSALFAGLEFYVDERVLIPRSPIAELIESHFAPWIEPDRVNNILDLCTGSGCIAIACAQYFPEANIDAVDIELSALEVARINANNHQVSDLVTLIHSDLFEALHGKKYDIIVSNPPYVDAVDMKALPAEYRHEPERALAAGSDGLDIVHLILKQAVSYLTETGILIVEVGNSAEALLAHYPQIPFTWLEFSRGESEVFLLTKSDLEHYIKNAC